jgi:hypothetical protein
VANGPTISSSGERPLDARPTGTPARGTAAGSVRVVPSSDLGAVLRQLQYADPAAIPSALTRAARLFGATDLVLYLADFGQDVLEPVPDRGAHRRVPETEPIATSMAGRAFTDLQAVTADRPEGVRVWAPIIEGSDRTGVLALTVEEATDEVVRSCEELALLAGYLIATQSKVTDFYNLYRRRKRMSLAAAMQWDLLPPLVLKTDIVSVAGLLEPAYDVGGDCFDYAHNDSSIDLAIVDAVGHGVQSALIASLTLGAYRRDRREGQTIDRMHENLDDAVREHCPPFTFATGQLAQIDFRTGTLRWTNAGHPLPLLIRGGQVVSELRCPPTPPWGYGSIGGGRSSPAVASEVLEPGDSVLFYTDGVIEARRPDGEQFGADRLADFVGRQASDQLEPEEVVRHIVRAVLEHQHDELADDATLVLIQWNGS